MDIQQKRKDEHFFIAEKLYSHSTNQLDEIQLIFDNLPELSLNDIDISTSFLNRKISAPFFINAMTGGSNQTDKINIKLANVAAKTNIPMATGSQSIALKNSEFADGFKKIRATHPNLFLLGNLGASHSFENFQKAKSMLQANAMELHLNVAQELTMPEGDIDFNWSNNIKNVIKQSTFPILVKGVGQGITPNTIKKLENLGVKYLDLSGKGGTNFVAIENQRRTKKDFSYLEDIGLTTAQSLLAAKKYYSNIEFTASGGIATALDIVKCLVLGAKNVGISGLFLHILIKDGEDGLISFIEDLKDQIRRIMLMLGCKNIDELAKVPYILSPALKNFHDQI